ncbi:MAG: hypothetical protein ACK5Q1_11250, partial [Limnobacter sp.]
TKGGQRYATATVTIRDSNGNSVPNAAVTGFWSGVVTGSVSGVTDSSGRITLKSPNSKRGGTFTFSISSVTKSGFVYQPANNAMTSNSVTLK